MKPVFENADRLIDLRLSESRKDIENFVWDNINPSAQSVKGDGRGIMKLNTVTGFTEPIQLGDIPEDELEAMAARLGYKERED